MGGDVFEGGAEGADEEGECHDGEGEDDGFPSEYDFYSEGG